MKLDLKDIDFFGYRIKNTGMAKLLYLTSFVKYHKFQFFGNEHFLWIS
jgi:hypothetical protein